MHLYEDAPSWGTEVFRARIASHGSPEQRAAMFDEKRASLSPFGFTAGAALCWSSPERQGSLGSSCGSAGRRIGSAIQ
jgi:hypothetical protein